MSLSIKNRNDSYHALNLPESIAKVYRAFVEIGPATNQQVSQYLGIPINGVTGRNNDLRKRNLLFEIESVKNNETGRGNTVYDVARNGQLSIF